jgi:glycosyltransferase involved in cell wall biosynthesis
MKTDACCATENKTTKLSTVSIIIPSIKSDIATLDSLHYLHFSHEIIISRKYGLGRARNWGASQASSSLLVFLDSDLKLNPAIWKHIFNIKLGEFGMTFVSGFPCSRVMAIHASDFKRIGGFDDSIRFASEDRDFYVRALPLLKYKEIPIGLTTHMPHERRTKNIHVAIIAIRENVQFIRKYWLQHPEVFRADVLDRLKRFQFRTLLIQLLWFFWLLGDSK